MIDIHTHILPGMDDGSRSLSESRELLRLEMEQGVEEVVLTPHFYAWQNDPETFLRRRQAAWDILQTGLPENCPKLHLGAEVRYFEGICQTEGLSRLCTDGSSSLLLEMPFEPWTSRMIADVMTLNRRPELQITLAHIERYAFRFAPRSVWPMFCEAGIRLQSNADFFLTRRTRRRALGLYDRGLIQILASDCHNLTVRPPNLAPGLEIIRKHSKTIQKPFP